MEFDGNAFNLYRGSIPKIDSKHIRNYHSNPEIALDALKIDLITPFETIRESRILPISKMIDRFVVTENPCGDCGLVVGRYVPILLNPSKSNINPRNEFITISVIFDDCLYKTLASRFNNDYQNLIRIDNLDKISSILQLSYRVSIDNSFKIYEDLKISFDSKETNFNESFVMKDYINIIEDFYFTETLDDEFRNYYESKLISFLRFGVPNTALLSFSFDISDLFSNNNSRNVTQLDFPTLNHWDLHMRNKQFTRSNIPIPTYPIASTKFQKAFYFMKKSHDMEMENDL